MKAFFCHGHHKVCSFCDEPHALKIVRENYLLILMLLRVSTWHIVAAAKHKQDLHTFSLFPCPDMADQATQFRGNNPSMAAMMPAKHHSRALQFPRRRERVKSKQQNSFRLRNASAQSWEKIFAKTLFSLSGLSSSSIGQVLRTR